MKLKFYCRYMSNNLPEYFQTIDTLERNNENHGWWTRYNENFREARPVTEYNRNVIRNSLPRLLNNHSDAVKTCIESKTYSLRKLFTVF